MNLINLWKIKKVQRFFDSRFQKETMKFLNREIRLNAKRVNEKADVLNDQVFSQIDCLDCGNCCKSIPPLLNDTDIARIARFLRMKPSAFQDQYIRFDEDGDTVISSTPCPFLGDNNSCLIYEVRPKACREYPHTGGLNFSRHPALHARNVAYCPAVYHILEGLKSLGKQ